MTEELNGQWVWVNPELTHDPDGKKDQIGIIEASDLADDTVLVSFEDSMPGLFSTDALFVLHIPEELSVMFAETTFPEPSPDLEVLLKIDKLAQKASQHDQRLALELARSHKDIQPFCLETLADKLNRDQYLNWNR